jgi:hypothetical protein
MEFRLTYDGPLRAANQVPLPHQKDTRADHKHNLRKRFHRQLKRLWEITPFLKSGERSGPGGVLLQNTGGAPYVKYHSDVLAQRHSMFGFNFVPLVTSELNLLCSLDILFLRPDSPGKIWQGDIDNRIKILLDALKLPEKNEDYVKRTPDTGEEKFYCLLEDDKLITKLAVETDQLLEFTTPQNDLGDVRLIITVRIRPAEVRLDNFHF